MRSRTRVLFDLLVILLACLSVFIVVGLLEGSGFFYDNLSIIFAASFVVAVITIIFIGKKFDHMI